MPTNAINFWVVKMSGWNLIWLLPNVNRIKAFIEPSFKVILVVLLYVIFTKKKTVVISDNIYENNLNV